MGRNGSEQPRPIVPVVYARLFRGFAKKIPLTIPMVLRVKYCWSRLYGKAHRSSPRSLHVGLRAAVLKPPLGHKSYLSPREGLLDDPYVAYYWYASTLAVQCLYLQ